MSINEADKPTVGSATSEKANEQLSQIPILPAAGAPAAAPVSTLTPGAAATAAAYTQSSGTEIAQGATAPDYAQADASRDPNAPVVVNAGLPGTNSDAGSGNDQSQPQAKPAEPLSLSQYLAGAANKEQYNRILQIMEDWAKDCGCDVSKLQAALEKEKLQDTLHYLQTVVETMHQIATRTSGVPAIVERTNGAVRIDVKFSDRRFNRSARLLSLSDGSIRVSYMDDNGNPSIPERLFENTPDTDAQEIVNSLVQWVTPNYQNVNA